MQLTHTRDKYTWATSCDAAAVAFHRPMNTEQVMCFQVYLGSYTECPEIPYAERSDDRTLFPLAFSIKLFVHKHPENSGFSGVVLGLTTPIVQLGSEGTV